MRIIDIIVVMFTVGIGVGVAKVICRKQYAYLKYLVLLFSFHTIAMFF